MGIGKTLETDWELDVARADYVLNLELGELGVESELLNDTSIPEVEEGQAPPVSASLFFSS